MRLVVVVAVTAAACTSGSSTASPDPVTTTPESSTSTVADGHTTTTWPSICIREPFTSECRGSPARKAAEERRARTAEEDAAERRAAAAAETAAREATLDRIRQLTWFDEMVREARSAGYEYDGDPRDALDLAIQLCEHVLDGGTIADVLGDDTTANTVTIILWDSIDHLCTP